MTLSSSEVKWLAISEAVKELIFVIQLLGSMKISVMFPVMVRGDNVGTIFVAMSCTKHLNIRYKYMNVHLEDGIVKIIFVWSTESDSHILTKNLSGMLHEQPSKNGW